MTTSERSRSPRYNQLKKRALEVFANHGGWLTPPQWAVLATFYPTRSAYTYLLRLHHLGLLERWPTAHHLVAYRLSPRGRSRLRWLQKQ
jgi:hypothetical protein